MYANSTAKKALDIVRDVLLSEGRMNPAILDFIERVVSINERLITVDHRGDLTVEIPFRGGMVTEGIPDTVDTANDRWFVKNYGSSYYAGDAYHPACIELEKLTDDKIEILADVLEGLETYPLVDDELHSEVEEELRDEYITSSVVPVVRARIGDGVPDTVIVSTAHGAREVLPYDIEHDGYYGYMSDDMFHMFVTEIVKRLTSSDPGEG